MTDDEIRWRLTRIYAALGDTRSQPEEVATQVVETDHGVHFLQDFTGGRTPEQNEKDAFAIINEIMVTGQKGIQAQGPFQTLERRDGRTGNCHQGGAKSLTTSVESHNTKTASSE